MKISHDTFTARVQACLGDLPEGEPELLFVWLHRLEALLARPPVERRETTGSDTTPPEDKA